jgi:hypothetical protein
MLNKLFAVAMLLLFGAALVLVLFTHEKTLALKVACFGGLAGGIALVL